MMDNTTTVPYDPTQEFWRTVPVPLAEGFTEAIQEIDEQIETGRIPGYKTMIRNLDNYFRLFPQEYLLIGARTSTGKTALALQLIDAVERQQNELDDNKTVVMFSAEMSKRALARRYATRKTGIPVARLRSEHVTTDELQRYKAALVDFRDEYRNILIDESPGPTIDHMLHQLSILRKQREIAMVVFDYIELAGEKAQSENKRITAISQGLTAIAKQLNCPVVGLSQLNRNIDSRADKKPNASDIMYGGEREPHVILLLQRDEVQANRVNAYIVKNREGATGQTALIFDGQAQRFTSGVESTTP